MTLSLNNYNINLIGKEQENTLDGKADTDLSNLTNEGQIKAAHLAMPSDTYIDLTFGSSGTSYTAPADGYFTIQVNHSATGGYSRLSSNVSILNYAHSVTSQGFIPVKKGNSVTLTYQAGSTAIFRFVYAVGSESEIS